MKMPSTNQWLLDYRAARDVEIIGRDTESSVPPSRVSTPDGFIHYFKACQKDSKEVGTNIIRNNSWEVILAYLQLHKAPLIASDIPSVSGIIVDEDALAGILLQDIQAAESLADYLSTITALCKFGRTNSASAGQLVITGGNAWISHSEWGYTKIGQKSRFGRYWRWMSTGPWTREVCRAQRDSEEDQESDGGFGNEWC